MLTVSLLFQGTWALAATTGGIAGVVHDDHGAPVAGAAVTASSPSQVATTTTDAQGHFIFLVLPPDTYTISVHKDGYQDVSVAGNTVFADQTQQVVIVTPRVLRVIATAHATAANLVKPGIGGDLYNVTPGAQQAAAALGGGGNLDNAYSAIASVPGLYVPTGGMGWNQSVVIHGNNPFTTGFEYDGVPVNRAFDQYNTSTESNLGLQELQVYTGGGPVSVASSGISGFINQVIKTGTYPGYATFTGGLATEAFYHEAKFEAGGSTPDRNFSYYVGVSGYDQAARVFDNQNGAALFQFGGVFNAAGIAGFPQALASNDFGFGVTAPCVPGSVDAQPASFAPGCLSYSSFPPGNTSFITDREDVVNLHLGIPRRDGQRDDIQALWSDSALQTFVYDSPNDFGPGVPQYTLNASLSPYVAGVNFPYYNDMTTYDLPFGTPVNDSTGAAPLPYQYYYEPDSPRDRGFAAQLPSNAEGVFHNDVGTVKLQWTHPFSGNAYLRVYAYSMFSDWTIDDPNSAYNANFDEVLAPDYDLITHTVGGQVQLADQINDQNLIQFTTNYTTASTVRWNNSGFINTAFCGGGAAALPCANSSPIGLISYSGGKFTCWGIGTNVEVPCIPHSGYADDAYDNATGGEPAITGAAALAGAQYVTLWNGNAGASVNTVAPQFINANLSEEWRPNDKILVDAAVRYDNYNYLLANTNTLQNQFYGQIIQNYSCVNPATDHPLLSPLGPGVPPPPVPIFLTTCPAGYVHPDGVGADPLFTVNSPANYDMAFWSGRFSATYTSDPDTVWRVSAGRYAEPPLTAAVQYQNASGNNLNQWANFMLFGFLSPFHAIAGETSAQYDLSYEHHFHGSNVSLKISPFYTGSSNWEQQYFIGAGYVTQIPVGLFRSYGVEVALQAGDFAQNGLSGQLSFTYTNAAVKYQSLVGTSIVDQLNEAIGAYNCLTGSYYSHNAGYCNTLSPSLHSLGGAQPCYNAELGVGGTCPGGAPPPIAAGEKCQTGTAPANDCWVVNPYYNQTPQPFMDPNGWYADPSGTGSALYFGDGTNDAEGFSAPYTAALILNYRVDKFAITPSLQFASGAAYGSPMDVQAVDPTACYTNQGAFGANTTNNPYDCAYTTPRGYSSVGYAGGGISPWGYLYVPNPQTGTFANYAQYTEPNIVMANIMASYDVSPKLRITVTAADLWHTCFGGSQEPWEAAAPPSQYVCGYIVNSVNYVGGLQGSGAYVGANAAAATNGVKPAPWENQSYIPSPVNGLNGYIPFNLYVQAQFHL